MSKHTPFKYYAGESRVYFAKNAGGFDLRGAPDGVEVAAFIVKAVNNHDALVAALRECRGFTAWNDAQIDAVLAAVEAA